MINILMYAVKTLQNFGELTSQTNFKYMIVEF